MLFQPDRCGQESSQKIAVQTTCFELRMLRFEFFYVFVDHFKIIDSKSWNMENSMEQNI